MLRWRVNEYYIFSEPIADVMFGACPYRHFFLCSSKHFSQRKAERRARWVRRNTRIELVPGALQEIVVERKIGASG